MFKINPYRSGAGLAPRYLAGRDKEIEEVEQFFDALIMGIPTQSIVFSGLHGVGKTVLINRLQQIAEEKEIFCQYIEVEDTNDFISKIAASSQLYLRNVSTKEKFKHLIQKPLDALKSLVVSFDSKDSTFSLSVQERELYKSNNLTQSLTEVFTTIGEIAQKTDIPLCIFIDEMQYMKQKELGSLIAALHRTNQLGYPVMVVGAGLPKLYKMLSDEKSYSERLFLYRIIGSLDEEQSRRAITIPAAQMEVEYTEDAIKKIIEITKGYPFYIQQLCQIVYQNTDNNPICESDVNNNISVFFKDLDTGFFRVRYERCSEMEKNLFLQW